MLRKLCWLCVKRLGFKIYDARTGEFLGRALVVSLCSRVYVIGYRGDKPLVPVFLPQKQLQYWRQELGFTSLGDPDFNNIRK